MNLVSGSSMDSLLISANVALKPSLAPPILKHSFNSDLSTSIGPPYLVNIVLKRNSLNGSDSYLKDYL